jgi:hypothetical protein
MPILEARLQQGGELVVEGLELPVEQRVDPDGVAEEDLRRRAILEKNADDPADILADLVGDAAVRVVRVDGLNRHADAGEHPVDDLLEDAALVLEIEIERAAGDPGGGDDVVDLGRVIPALREDIARVVQDLLAALGLVHGDGRR